MTDLHDEQPNAVIADVAVKLPGWQPIDTAPKNGDDILVYYEFAEQPIAHIAFWDEGEHWEEQEFPNQDEARGWWSYVRGSVTQEKLDGPRTPTHWMPFEAPSPERSVT